MANTGRVSQIIGPVIDVTFSDGKLPNLLNALIVKGTNANGEKIELTAEVQQLLGDHTIRAISMTATEGLMRGLEVIDTGSALTVPVGDSVRPV